MHGSAAGFKYDAQAHRTCVVKPKTIIHEKDMSAAEKSVMQAHVVYWAPYVEDGTVVVLGPVMDPKGGYGIAVVRVDHEDQLEQIIANDPGNGLNSYEWYPMRAVTRS